MRPAGRITLTVAALAILAGISSAGAGTSIRWQTDYRKALAQAGKRKTIVMIDFYGTY